MDGLSLAASVIAVIQLAGSCLKLARRWAGPSEFGSADLVTITNTLYEFNGVMKTFQTHMEIHEDDEARLSSLEHLKAALGRCKQGLDIVKDFMENSNLIGKYVIGPRFDRKLKGAMKALDGAKELFMLSLHADQQVIILGVERYTRNLMEDFRDFRADVATNLKRLHENGDEVYKEVKRARREQDAREDHEQQRAILDWLTPIDYAHRQADFIDRRQAGTGEWLLESTEYRGWIRTGKQTLFCSGIPGAGKTILAAIVIDNLIARYRQDPEVGVAYIYCDFRQRDDQKAVDLLKILLKQLSQRRSSVPDSARELYDNHIDNRTRPSFEEVLVSLQSVAALYSRVFIVIDALDEYQTYDGCRGRFLSGIFRIQDKCGASLLATSRAIPEITREFEGSISLEILASEDDVRQYLDGHMFKLPSFIQRSIELQEEIKTRIVQSVRGMFLLAQLHLDSLVGKRSVKAVRTALTKLPTGSDAYDCAYRDVMDRIEGQVTDQKELALQVLSWVTSAKRPLTTSELQHALTVEIGTSAIDEENCPEIEDMVSACAGLITIDKDSSIIRLVHYTAQEYFQRTQQRWFPNAERDLAMTCLTYLSFDGFRNGICLTDEEFEERLGSNPLYDYAAQNWGHHGRAALREAKELMLDFLSTESLVSSSCQAMMVQRDDPIPPGYSQNIPVQGQNLNSKDSHSRTPLFWAAETGQESVVRLLLADNRVEPDGKDSIYIQTPLSWAAERGHTAVVKLLLEKDGVDPNLGEVIHGLTPLALAASRGHEETMKLLLTKEGIEKNSRDFAGRTPLFLAALRGHEKVVELLLATEGVDPRAEDAMARTPLSMAMKRGHEGVIKLINACI
ncbi:Serine/threonine-protein phosphatase 6 regulatory ankyrin repeat subunit B [Cladobotryum mycophilum]|uniref:Serine/threonine-protein phosphatase 6 regulatory ankyrin repeat subunit B n=1 Tax=Cladobotryum mycophilum TaxID=491253 RepID=A0ABR0SH32_9HYPO